MSILLINYIWTDKIGIRTDLEATLKLKLISKPVFYFQRFIKKMPQKKCSLEFITRGVVQPIPIQVKLTVINVLLINLFWSFTIKWSDINSR